MSPWKSNAEPPSVSSITFLPPPPLVMMKIGFWCTCMWGGRDEQGWGGEGKRRKVVDNYNINRNYNNNKNNTNKTYFFTAWREGGFALYSTNS